MPSVDVIGGKWVSRQPRENTVSLAVFPQATFMGCIQSDLAVIARIELIGLPAFGFGRLGLDGKQHRVGQRFDINALRAGFRLALQLDGDGRGDGGALEILIRFHQWTLRFR